MAVILNALVAILEKPTAAGVMAELVILAAPLWLAVFVGVFVGWAWRPKWAMDLVSGFPVKKFDLKVALGPSALPISPSVNEEEEIVDVCLPAKVSETLSAVKEDDLEHLIKVVDVTDGGPAWQQMMEKNLPTFTYRAWKRDPENGLPQYRSSTIFEDATPEMVRDFFWDDEFRIKNKWDDMLLHHNTLEECPITGAMLVHWIRKFPFFCSDREYIIGRRIWVSGRTYYCVTKGVPSSSIPRRNKPRRVDLYYSSWCIRPVESRRGDGQLTACEVLLFHHEDMGIPWEIAKLGVKQGMWGCVKKIEPGLRAYQKARIAGEPLSRCAYLAQINTKVKPDYLMIKSLETSSSSLDIVEPEKEKHWRDNVPKMLVIGGAVALACNIDHGLITKAVIFGVARRFANIGKKL